MSWMIKIKEGCYVAADQIAEIKVSESTQTITVTTKDGERYSRYPEYRQGVYSTLDDLVSEVNLAMADQSGNAQ